MTVDETGVLRDLLTGQRVLSLGVLVDGQPWVGLLPFAVKRDFSAVLVHASQLARHTAGLGPDARFSALIHEPDRPGADALQRPRLTVLGKATLLERDTPRWREARDLYVAKFPSSQMTFELGDFGLYELALDEGRLVIGFAKAVDVGHDDFQNLAGQA